MVKEIPVTASRRMSTSVQPRILPNFFMLLPRDPVDVCNEMLAARLMKFSGEDVRTGFGCRCGAIVVKVGARRNELFDESGWKGHSGGPAIVMSFRVAAAKGKSFIERAPQVSEIDLTKASNDHVRL
jgi:hypothetical protein